MGFLSNLGKVASWLPDVSAGQVFDIAVAPGLDKADLFSLAMAVKRGVGAAQNVAEDTAGKIDDALSIAPGYRLQKRGVQGFGDKVLPALDKAWDQGTRPFSTANLQLRHVAEGDFDSYVDPSAWKESWDASDKITLGQSAVAGGILSILAVPAARTADERLGPREREALYEVFPWLRPGFDITDTKQRNEAFRDNMIGKFGSGAQDMVARWWFDPANVATVGAVRAVRLNQVKKGRLITSDNVDTALASSHTERALDWIEAEKAKGGDVAARLHDHPELRKNSHGAWVATALADAKDRDQARDVLGMLYGSNASYERLVQSNQALADRITLAQLESMGLDNFRTVGDPLAVTDEFVAANVPERLAAVQRQLNEMVTEEALNARSIEVAGLFQGERALDFGAREDAFIHQVRNDVFQKGSGNRILRFVRPAVAMAPHKMVNVNRPNSSLQVERFLRQTRAPIAEQDELLEQYMRAVTPAERAMLLNDIENKAVAYALRDFDDVTREEILKAAQYGRNAASQALAGAERRYAGNLEYSLVKVQDGNEVIHYPLMVSQTQDVVPMVDIKQLNRLADRYSSSIKLMRQIHPGRPLVDFIPDLADRFYRVWKPATLLRPAWPIRVVGDEQLRIIGKLQGMQHRSWMKLGMAEMDHVQGARQTPRELRKVGKGFRLEEVPRRKNKKADLVAPEREPIDAEFASGQVSEEEFATALKAMAEDTGFVPEGYEDIWSAYRTGNITEDEFIERSKQAALLRNNGFDFAQGDAERFHRTILDKDGFTIDINTGTVPTKGYAVSTRPDLAEVVDYNEFKAIGPSQIRQFINKNRSELLKPGRVLGAWVDEVDGRQVVYLDVSRVLKDRKVAEEVGAAVNQRAIFDIENFDEIPTGGDGTFDIRNRNNFSEAVTKEQYRRIQERIAVETGEEVDSGINYDRLQGAYLGISRYNGVAYAGPFGTGPDVNQMWDLSASRGVLHNLAEHHERDGINQVRQTLKNWTAVEPHQPGYALSWEVSVNQHLASDPMARQFLEGRSYDEVVNWLRNTKEGILHRRTLPVRGQNPEEWVGMVEDMVNTYVPGERLRAMALEGRARHADLVDEVGVGGSLPVVHGEALKTALGTSDYWKKWEDFVAKGYNTLGGLPTDILSRHPYFATMYHAKIRQVIDTWAKQGAEFTPERISGLERMGREFALSEVKKLLYDLAEQSELARMLRFVSPFYGAWQETLTRWAGIAAENPQVLTRAHLVWDSPHKAGLVYDRQTGEPIYDAHSGVDLKDQIIRLRLPKWAVNDIPGAEFIPGAELAQWVATFGGNAEGVTLSKGGFNLITMGEPWWMPGAGPSVQIPVNEVIKDRPDLLESPLGKYILPYGPTNTGSTVRDAFQLSLPTAGRRLFSIPQDEGNPVFANMKLRIYTTEMTKYHQGMRPKKPTWKEATRKAQDMFIIWAVASWVSPTGIAPISPVEPFVIEYRALLKADETADRSDPNYMSPDAKFLEKYGEELFALTGSLTKSANSAPATLGSYKATKKYESLIRDVTEEGSPELAGLIIGKEGAGEFNYSVYQYQLQADTYPGSGVKQRRRLRPQEKIADRNAAAGWIKYRKIMDQIEHERVTRGLSSLYVKDAADLRFLKDVALKHLREDNPDWALDYDQVDRGVMRRRITNLRAVLEKDKALRGRQDMQGVLEYLNLRDQVVLELRRRQASTLTAQSNADLAFLFQTQVAHLVERNLAFQDTYYRYLERDELSAKDPIGGK